MFMRKGLDICTATRDTLVSDQQHFTISGSWLAWTDESTNGIPWVQLAMDSSLLVCRPLAGRHIGDPDPNQPH